MAKSSARAKPATPEPVADVRRVTESLAEPFDPTEVKFKPAVISSAGNRALALAYVDARVIQDRLDAVLGVDGWQDSYKVLEDGTVVCRLRLRLGDRWVTKVDVGSPSEQGDSGDRRKAAFSDALKRAAVKFGIGRYLYRFPQQWVDYDPHKKQFTKQPKIPPFAMPRQKKAEADVPDEPAAEERPQPTAKPEPKKAEPAGHAPEVAAKSAALPANGEELHRRLADKDTRLAKQGLCRPGDLVKYVVAEGIKAGYDPELSAWDQEAIRFAAEVTREFENDARGTGAKKREVA